MRVGWRGGGGVPLPENNWKGLVPYPGEAVEQTPLLPGFSRQRYQMVGTIFSSRWGCKLALLPGQGARQDSGLVQLIVWGPESGQSVH